MEKKKVNVFGIIGFVLAIIGLILGCFTGFIALIFVIPGLALCIVGLVTAKKRNAGKGLSLAGTIVAGIALILSITIGSVSLAALSAIDEALDAGNTLPENIAEDITEDVLDDVEDVVIPGNADDAEEIDSGSNDDDADTNEFISDDIAVKYVSHNTVKDYEDNDCLRVVFEYTNNSDDTTSFMFSTNVSAFQNGVELDTAVTLDEDEEENNSLKEVRPGTTINVARIFVLEDTSDVEIEVSELISFDDDKMLMTLPVE